MVMNRQKLINILNNEDSINPSLPFDFNISDISYVRKIVANNPNIMFIYDENLEYTSGNNDVDISVISNEHLRQKLSNSKYPDNGEQCIRGLPNAYPIVTKPSNEYDVFYDSTKSDWDRFLSEIDLNISVIIEEADKYDFIVFLSSGFASIYSRLPNGFAEALSVKLNMLIRKTDISNTPFEFRIVFNRYIPSCDDIYYHNRKWYSVIPDYPIKYKLKNESTKRIG